MAIRGETCVIIHRASELGRCIRASVADRLGYRQVPTSDRMQGLYDRGNEHEEACVAALLVEGWTVIDSQKLVGVDVTDGVRVEGHLDGMTRPNDYVLYGEGVGLRVLEIKAPSTYASFDRAYHTNDYSNSYMSRIVWQVSVYMVATGLECVMACLNDDGRVETFGIETPPHSRQEIINRVVTIEDWVARGELPPECSQQDFPCPYFPRVCTGDARIDIEDTELAELLLAYSRSRDAAKLEAEFQKNLRTAIDTLAPGVGKYRVNGVPVTWYETTRTSLDKEKMAADGIDLSAYEKTTTSTSMRVGDDDS